MKYGVLLTRAQPFHTGHISVIRNILTENDKALIVIGSANKSGTKRNPLSIDFRFHMVELALQDSGLSENTRIISLMDWSMETAYQYAKEWGCFLYYNIVNVIGQKSFSLYYNDDPGIVENWFPDGIKNRIMIKHVPRIDEISSTRIREAIVSGDDAYLRSVLSPGIFDIRNQIKLSIEGSTSEDFIMS